MLSFSDDLVGRCTAQSGLVVKSGRNPFTDGLENRSVTGKIMEN